MGVWGRKFPSGVQGQSILRVFGYQNAQNFVYLAKVHESLVKHEKNDLQRERQNRGTRVSGCSPNFWSTGALFPREVNQ